MGAVKAYGLPFMGSKNKIAKALVDALPAAHIFVDLFAGGCAVTHAAMLSGKYKEFIANDISDAPQLFADAIEGKYRDERRWISCEDFFALKDTDPYVRLCWSFGTNLKDYIYSAKIEPYKEALWQAVMFGEWGGAGSPMPRSVGSLQGKAGRRGGHEGQADSDRPGGREAAERNR